MVGYFPKLNSKSQKTVELLCATARKGLVVCYFDKDLLGRKHGLGNHDGRLSMALHLRYVIMAQIGVKRWLRFHGDDNVLLPDLWAYIWSGREQINSAGDLALAVWAGVESGAIDCRVFAKKLANDWGFLRGACNAVELAWVVQGMVRFSQCHEMTDKMIDLLKDAHKQLADLYCQGTALFARHNRRGVTEAIRRRVVCFADQVYPILALVNYGRDFNDSRSIDIAASVADTICRLQGAGGQWWWHYDVRTGAVVEEYPIFAVHQDGMAPMALLAIDELTGTDHSLCIERGLQWLSGSNELNEAMIVPEAGVVWRDIHRREPGKMYRLARGMMITAGLNKAHRLAGGNVFGYVVNRECRPYHLGWILYAWSGRIPKSRGQSGKKTAEAIR